MTSCRSKHGRATGKTGTPAHGQHRDLPEVTAALLRPPGGRLPHQRPLLLVAARADVLGAARSADGVKVAAGVLFCSSGWPWGQRGQRRGGGARGCGGERRPTTEKSKVKDC